MKEPGVPFALVAAAPLQADEIQNLSDVVGELVKATVGLNLQFHLNIEISHPSRVPDHETIARVNVLLSEVSDKLKLQ